MIQRITAILAVLVIALVAVAPALSVSQWGRTATPNAPFKVGASTVYSSTTLTGSSSKVGQYMQTRLLANGSQLGSIVTYNLAAGANYNSTVTTGYTCQFGTLKTYVGQTRLGVTGQTPTAWDSGPGKSFAC